MWHNCTKPPPEEVPDNLVCSISSSIYSILWCSSTVSSTAYVTCNIIIEWMVILDWLTELHCVRIKSGIQNSIKLALICFKVLTYKFSDKSDKFSSNHGKSFWVHLLSVHSVHYTNGEKQIHVQYNHVDISLSYVNHTPQPAIGSSSIHDLPSHCTSGPHDFPDHFHGHQLIR